MEFWIINGPNLNLLGLREPDIYGKKTYQDLEAFVQKSGEEADVMVRCYQSNHEGALVDIIQDAYQKADGIIINPAAYTHTSIALLDALKAVCIPTVEVHLSDVSNREEFRKMSYIKCACIETITGLGFEGYREAMLRLKAYYQEKGQGCAKHTGMV